jgi:hypothetical protein
MSWKTETVYADVDEIIDQIPTTSLEEELVKRKELQVSDIKLAERKESRRSSEVSIEIDPDDYDLVNQDDVRPSLSDFSETELIKYLKSRGYRVYGDEVDLSSLERLAQDLQDVQQYKLKGFLCDLFELSHMASKEDIINEMKSKIK